MNKELDKRLVEAFPLLYADRHRSMQETCMCWGFDCGDGWFDIIWELSEKLEPIIAKMAEEQKYDKCYNCYCKFNAHRMMPSGKRICTTVHKVPYTLFRSNYGSRVPQWKQDIEYYGFWQGIKINLKKDWEYTRYKMKNRLSRVWSIWYKLGIKKKVPCKCLGFEVAHPRVSQVKEKFGTLRFYMSSGNNEMWDLIDKAEEKSMKTCETCGKPGELRGGGWIKTLCNECAKKEGQEQTHEDWVKEREENGDKLYKVVSFSMRKDAK